MQSNIASDEMKMNSSGSATKQSKLREYPHNLALGFGLCCTLSIALSVALPVGFGRLLLWPVIVGVICVTFLRPIGTFEVSCVES